MKPNKALNMFSMLPDFEEHDDVQVAEEVVIPEGERLANITNDDLDALKKQAYQEGYEAGQKAAHDTLTVSFGQSLDDVIKVSQDRHISLADEFKKASDGFTDILTDAIEHISSDGLDKTTLSRSIESDIKEFIETLTDAEIIISCSESDKVLLESVLKHDNVSYNIVEGAENGHVTLSYNRSYINLDVNDWKKSVHKHIMKAVYSLLTAYHSEDDHNTPPRITETTIDKDDSHA